MILRLLLCVLLATCALPGCTNPDKKKKESAEAAKKKKKEPPTMRDVSNDTGFQAFIGRLRIAAARKDKAEMATMLAPDFGYRWDNAPAGESPFDYWEQTDSWGELQSLLSQRFVPHENYMAAPAEFVADPEGYDGYRAGIRLVNGSWKLAYFVTGKDVLQ